MNSRTKKIILLVSGILLLTVGACLFLLYQINEKGNLLKEYISVLDERNAQEASFIRVRRLVQETESNRNTITAAFFKDESDSISFLGEIESFAAAIGLQLKTEDLNKVTGADKKTEYITMTFVYGGPKDTVENFTRYLESVPYHSWVQSLELQKSQTGFWEGRLTLYITIQPS